MSMEKDEPRFYSHQQNTLICFVKDELFNDWALLEHDLSVLHSATKRFYRIMFLRVHNTTVGMKHRLNYSILPLTFSCTSWLAPLFVKLPWL